MLPTSACLHAGEMLEEMPYATAVIRESLRFRPAVPGVMRRAKEDLQVGDYNVPKVYQPCMNGAPSASKAHAAARQIHGMLPDLHKFMLG